MERDSGGSVSAPPVTPRFTHDCTACVYLGTEAEYDFYYCPNCERDMGGTLIARYGSDGWEYASSGVSLVQRTLREGWQVFATKEFVPGSDPRVSVEWKMARAMRLAKEQGFIAKEQG